MAIRPPLPSKGAGPTQALLAPHLQSRRAEDSHTQSTHEIPSVLSRPLHRSPPPRAASPHPTRHTRHAAAHWAEWVAGGRAGRVRASFRTLLCPEEAQAGFSLGSGPPACPLSPSNLPRPTEGRCPVPGWGRRPPAALGLCGGRSPAGNDAQHRGPGTRLQRAASRELQVCAGACLAWRPFLRVSPPTQRPRVRLRCGTG